VGSCNSGYTAFDGVGKPFGYRIGLQRLRNHRGNDRENIFNAVIEL